MSGYDLTEAIREASDHLHADACPEDMDGCICGHYDREADIALTAALPHLEQQIRAQIAAEIESRAWEVASVHQFHTTTCTCGFYSPVARQRTEHILAQIAAADIARSTTRQEQDHDH